MNELNSILITGANRGLGLGFTKSFLAKGYRVFATCREPTRAAELLNLREENTKNIFVIEMDVSSSQNLKKAFQIVSMETDRLDILLNNAGVYGPSRGIDFLNLKDQDILDTFSINTLGPLRVTQTFLPLLLKSDVKKLVQISSLMGSVEDNTSGGSYGYRLSKASLNMLNRNFACEFKEKGVISVALHPGWVKTDMGGKGAPLEIDQAVGSLVDLIENLTEEKNGMFLNYRGDIAPY